MTNSKKLIISYLLLAMLLGSCTKNNISSNGSPSESPLLPTNTLTEFPSSTTEITKLAPTTTASPTNTPLPPTVTLTETPSLESTVPLPLPSFHDQPTNQPTKTPSPTIKPTLIPTQDASSLSDQKTEYFKNAWLSSVELSKENFPDETFLTLISKVVDKDNDGILTLEERETLVYLRDTFYDKDSDAYEPDDMPDDYLMTQLVPKITDFTGIEYFPQLKTIYIKRSGNKYKLSSSMNLTGLPNLENIFLQISSSVPKDTYYFNFKHLPCLQSIKIEVNNLDSTSHLSLNDTKELQEFRITGNIATLDGLEQTNVQKMILKLDKISGELSLFSHEASEFAFDLTGFTNLSELHIYMPEKDKTYIFRNGTALETLGVNAFDSTVIFHNMPKLQDVRVLGATAIKNENCPKLEILKLAMSKSLEHLDLSSFSTLKILEVAWKTMEVKSLILPNDTVDIATLHGKTNTTITYQEQPVFQKMQQAFKTVFLKPTALSGSAINYEKVSDESLSTPGIFEFTCKPGYGYEIDLDGDGITEKLYTDSEDFYINGTRLGISRSEYNDSQNPWETFWIIVSGKDTQTRRLILNTAPLERYHYSMDAASSSLPEYYWMGDDPMEWGGKTDFQSFVPDSYIGQSLLSYDGELHLQAYAESGTFWYYDMPSNFYPFTQAEYNPNGISFSHIKNRWIRVYGTDEIPSLYFEDDN